MAEILFVFCVHDEKNEKLDFSILPPAFATLGFISFIALRILGFRELNKKGELLISPFGKWLYGAYNSVNESFVMFSPIFRSERYNPVLYDDKSLLWTIFFAIIFGVPACLYAIIHFRGYPAFSTIQSKAIRALEQTEQERLRLRNQLSSAENTNNALQVKLKTAADEISRLKEDFAAFQKTSGQSPAVAKSELVAPPSKGADVDSDTL